MSYRNELAAILARIYQAQAELERQANVMKGHKARPASGHPCGGHGMRPTRCLGKIIPHQRIGRTVHEIPQAANRVVGGVGRGGGVPTSVVGMESPIHWRHDRASLDGLSVLF